MLVMVRRKNGMLPSAAVTVTEKTLNEAPSSDFVNELKGRTAGVDIVSNGSTPGSTSQIRIRGNRTMVANTTNTGQVNNP